MADFIARARQISSSILKNNTFEVIENTTQLDPSDGISSDSIGLKPNDIITSENVKLTDDISTSLIISSDTIFNQNDDRDNLTSIPISTYNLVPQSYDGNVIEYSKNLETNLPNTKILETPNMTIFNKKFQKISDLNVNIIKSEIASGKYIKCDLLVFDELFTRYYLLSKKIPNRKNNSIPSGKITVIVFGFDSLTKRYNIFLPFVGINTFTLSEVYLTDQTVMNSIQIEN